MAKSEVRVRGLLKTRPSLIVAILLNPRWTQESLSSELVHDIIAAYEQHGYVYQYFGFMNSQSPFVQARLGQVAPAPRSFERAVSSTLELYSRMLQIIANPPPLEMWLGGLWGPQPIPLEHVRVYLITPPGRIHWRGIPGWTKEALRDAIIKSGLGIRDDTGKMVLPAKNVGIRLGHTRGDTGNLPGIFNRVNQKRQTIHSSNAYMPRAYYETLYRKIFNTPAYIDWAYYCQNQR